MDKNSGKKLYKVTWKILTEIRTLILSDILKSKETETREVDYFKLAMMWAERQCMLMKVLPTPANKRLLALEKLFFL